MIESFLKLNFTNTTKMCSSYYLDLLLKMTKNNIYRKARHYLRPTPSIAFWIYSAWVLSSEPDEFNELVLEVEDILLYVEATGARRGRRRSGWSDRSIR